MPIKDTDTGALKKGTRKVLEWPIPLGKLVPTIYIGGLAYPES